MAPARNTTLNGRDGARVLGAAIGSRGVGWASPLLRGVVFVQDPPGTNLVHAPAPAVAGSWSYNVEAPALRERCVPRMKPMQPPIYSTIRPFHHSQKRLNTRLEYQPQVAKDAKVGRWAEGSKAPGARLHWEERTSPLIEEIGEMGGDRNVWRFLSVASTPRPEIAKRLS